MPAGFNFVQVALGLYINNLTIGSLPTLQLRKNAVAIVAAPSQNAAISWGITLTSGLLPVSPGDYIDAFFQVTGDASADITAARSFMSMQLIP